MKALTISALMKSPPNEFSFESQNWNPSSPKSGASVELRRAFDVHTGSILVTNHASLVPFDPNLFAVFSVFVDDKGSALP
jgi:hypothetical protein